MLTINDFDEVTVSVTTDRSLPAYSHSMLNAIATCPTLGLVTYVANRVMRHSGRALALEAGSASHAAYAAARLWQMGEHQQLWEHTHHHGVRMFGQDRYDSMVLASREAGSDRRNAMLRFCLEAFYTSGFYDDPSDKRRTFTNIEEALIAYLDRVDYRRNVWVQDVHDPTSMVGIEIPVDVTVSYITHGVEETLDIRFIGTADGLHWRGDELVLEDNKTASRLGEVWAQAQHTSHQYTIYMMALSTMLGVHIRKAAVHGMAIPLPRSYDAGGLMTETVTRTSAQFRDVLSWLLHLAQLVVQYGSNPTEAPKHTGACNKYFRACSLIPLCASDTEDRQEMFAEMVQREPSPTERAMEEGDY